MLKRMEVALSKRECTYAPLHSARDFEAVRIAWLVIMLSLFCRDILIGLPGSQKIRIAPIDTMHLHVDELGLQFKMSKFSKFPHLPKSCGATWKRARLDCGRGSCRW